MEKEKADLKNDAEFISSFVDKAISSRFEFIEYLARDVDSLDELVKRKIDSNKLNSFEDGFSVISASGGVVSGEEYDKYISSKFLLNSIKKDFFEKITQNKSNYVVGKDRFLMIGTENMVAIFSVPIRNKNRELIGFLVQKRNLGIFSEFDISNLLHHERSLISGYHIISRSDSVYVSSTDEKKSMKLLPAPGLFPAVDRRRNGDMSSVVTVDSYGDEIISSASAVRSANWYVVTYIKRSNIYRIFYRSAIAFILFVIIVFFAIGFCIINFLKMELSPIESIANSIDAHTNGNGDLKFFDFSGSPEIEKLATSINYLNKKITIANRLQSARNRKLIKALDAAKKALNEKSIAEKNEILKSDFVSNVSHEIRAPLNAIASISRLLNDTNHSEYAASLVGKLDKSCKSMVSIVNEVLDFQKIGDKSFTLSVKDFSLDELVTDVSSIIEPHASSKGLELIIDKPNEYYISGDYFRLRQVLINLLSNAVKYTNSGFVSLSIVLIDSGKTIFFENGKKIANLRFSISDSGKGVDENMLNKIFLPFERVLDFDGEDVTGTGLGLSISSKIVENMKSHIDVRSSKGKGSTFSFDLKLPLANKIRPVEFTQVVEFPNRLDGVKILYADDSVENLDLMKIILEARGAVVNCAANGLEALQLIDHENGNFDLILMDIRMPIMDGIESARHIRKKYGVPIFAFTGSIESFNDKHADNNDFHMALGKPVDLEHMVRSFLNSLKKDYFSLDLSVPELKIFDSDLVSDLVFDIDRALFNWCDADLMNRTLEEFFSSYKDLPSSIRGGDPMNFEDVIHKISGTSGLLCLNVLHPAAFRLLENMESGRVDGLDEFFFAHKVTFDVIGEYLAKEKALELL